MRKSVLTNKWRAWKGEEGAVEEGKDQIMNGFIHQRKEFRLHCRAAKKTVGKQ